MSNYREMILDIINKEDYKPVTIDHFVQALDAHDSENFKEVVKVMVALEEEGIVVRTKKDKYMKVTETNLVKGKLSMHKRGFGFLRDRKSTRLNSSHVAISYAVFCLKKK